MISNDKGQIVYNEEMIQHFVSIYEKQLGTEVNCDSIWDRAAELIKEVRDEEIIKEAMFSVGDDKASGPDGFSSQFFKSFVVLFRLMFVMQ